MASASLHGDRSQVVSRGKKPPSPLVQGSKTPTPRSTDTKKRLNSSDGSSKRFVPAAKVPTPAFKSATRHRPSDVLNPKTVDPVGKYSLDYLFIQKSLDNDSSFIQSCSFFFFTSRYGFSLAQTDINN